MREFTDSERELLIGILKNKIGRIEWVLENKANDMTNQKKDFLDSRLKDIKALIQKIEK